MTPSRRNPRRFSMSALVGRVVLNAPQSFSYLCLLPASPRVRVIPPQRYAPHVSAPMLCPRPAPQSGDCVRGRSLRLGASPLRCVPLRRRNSVRCSTAHGRPLVRLVVAAAPRPARMAASSRAHARRLARSEYLPSPSGAPSRRIRRPARSGALVSSSPSCSSCALSDLPSFYGAGSMPAPTRK